MMAASLGCLLGTNLIVPSGAIITGLGVFAGAGAVAWTFVIWAACGAALGMSASYTIGLRLGSRIETLSLLRTRPELILRARERSKSTVSSRS
jgi:membrane protein DedA with SNARE-associated domain